MSTTEDFARDLVVLARGSLVGDRVLSLRRRDFVRDRAVLALAGFGPRKFETFGRPFFFWPAPVFPSLSIMSSHSRCLTEEVDPLGLRTDLSTQRS